METSEEFTVVPKDQRRIIRGKRTKRPRPFAVTSSSSSSGCSGGGKGGGEDVYFSAHSPSENSGCTEEDEDMANCLILLAQSGGGGSKQQMAEDVKKFSSRKFTEMATTGGKAGFNVYECKTCSRSFPSFQALGGHRASHKRPKPLEEKKIVLTSLNDKDDQEREENVEFNKISQSLSFYKFAQGINSKPKVHECSICGSEFASGQALGGHMRRHRAPTTNPQTTTTSDTNVVVDDQKPRNILQLDLNLPAPEDDHRDSKFPFLFSSPALVGCHY